MFLSRSVLISIYPQETDTDIQIERLSVFRCCNEMNQKSFFSVPRGALAHVNNHGLFLGSKIITQFGYSSKVLSLEKWISRILFRSRPNCSGSDDSTRELQPSKSHEWPF